MNETPRLGYVDYLESLSRKQLMLMLARARQDETQGIGVIGMGCRFPGGIDTPDGFWNLLRDAGQVRTVDALPTDSLGRPRWNLEAADLAPLAGVLRFGAYLSNIDLFDAEYFGLSDEESRYMDPQQRLLLEVTIQALADANLSRAALRKQRVGIFVATGFLEYASAALRNGMTAEKVSPHMLQSSSASAASGRLGLMLGVNGPAVTLDTASSSALSAVHLAMSSLRRRDCDLAIVGSCQLLLSPFTTLMLSRGGALSATGESRPFSSRADGHVRGEGCGVFVLKRQAQIAAEHDRPYAMIRGSAVHQHGDRLALSVASAAGQKAVIELALRNAGVEPHDVQYVEAQANGSQLGGAIEAEAMASAYGRRDSSCPPLYVGSCKANLGYLEVASGAPALMKVALALSHGEIPPHRGADTPDPGIPWDDRALSLATEPVAWPSRARRMAGISAFGMNGINAHLIMEAAAVPAVGPGPDRPDAVPALLAVSGHNDAAFRATARRLHTFLKGSDGWHHGAACRTLIEGRDHSRIRAARVIHSRADLLDQLALMAERPVTAPARGDRAVFLSLPDLSAEFDGSASLPDPAASAGLHRRVVSYADAMSSADPPAGGPGRTLATAHSLAWSLACLDVLNELGIELRGCSVAGPYRNIVLQRFVGILTSEQVCERWAHGQTDLQPIGTGWEFTTTAACATLQRPFASISLRNFTPTPRNVAQWLALIASQYDAGSDLNWSAWFGEPGPMMRLPGPVLIGKPHWPENYRWS